MLTPKDLKKIILKYGEAWEKQDPNKILEIFTEDATYKETPFKKYFKGHKNIRKYWNDKVKLKQKKVKFKLISAHVSGNIGIAEWMTKFISNDNGNEKELRGIILVKIVNGKIKKLWEYWHKEEKNKISHRARALKKHKKYLT